MATASEAPEPPGSPRSEGDIENAETRVMGRRPAAAETPAVPPMAAEPPPASDPAGHRDPMTELIGPRRRRRQPPPAVSEDGDADPVVGWLVVVDGPGRGQARRLGYGRNGIGRDADQAVCLDFGDDHISHKEHAWVVYDPRARRFLLHHGQGRNLTYVGDRHALVPVELNGGDQITLGRTVLRFVPLCGADFDWQDAGSATDRL